MTAEGDPKAARSDESGRLGRRTHQAPSAAMLHPPVPCQAIVLARRRMTFVLGKPVRDQGSVDPG